MKNNNSKKNLRKASSILIFSKQYEILFLKRHKKLSFANMLAFPGGGLESKDKEIYSKYNRVSDSQNETKELSYLRITSLRETFEECGIYITKLDENNTKEKIIKKLMEKSNEEIDHFEKLINIIPPFLDLPSFIRFITIQDAPVRFDTMFYIAEIENTNYICLNIKNFMDRRKYNSLFDIKNLIINKDESDYYIWDTPLNTLLKFYNKEVNLAPPQILFMSLLSTLNNYKELLNIIEILKKNEIKMKNEINELMKNPFYFPLIMKLKKTKKELIWLLPGDKDYSFKEMAENEICEEIKENYLNFEKDIFFSKPQTFRILFNFDSKNNMTLNKFEIESDFENLISIIIKNKNSKL